MQSQNQMFDDLVKIINGAAGTIAGMGREAQAGARDRAKEWFGGLDFVSRDEFEAVKAMAAAARDEADVLRTRLDALEASTAHSPAASPTTPPDTAGQPELSPAAAPLLSPAPTIDEVDG
ncbi:accessory factor UbiK family protein [uncultured Sphingomonas sp.]|uniref:accessory factor UbiK family protein n=1 Tax=uncultured Sphingomonas sp. TaxID=158754 RepID=UPI0035CB4C2C